MQSRAVNRAFVLSAFFLKSSLLLPFNLPTALAADDNSKPAESAVEAEADVVTAKRKELAAQIDALAKGDGNETDDADVTHVSAAEDEVEFLETLDAVYAQQQGRLEQREGLKAEKKRANDDLESLRRFGPSEAKPYSFLLLENLRQELATEENREDVFKADIKAAEQMLEAACNHFDECEKDRRKTQEEIEENEDEDQAAELATALKLDKLRSQIAEEQIKLRRLEVEVRTQRRDVCTARKLFLDEKIGRIAKDVKFTTQDLQDRQRELKAFDAELTRKLKDARTRLQQAELQHIAAVKELQNQKSPQSTIDLANESWHIGRDALQTDISLLSERIGDNKRLRHYWSCRYEVENGTADNDSISEWYESLSGLLDEIHDNQRSLEQRIETARDELTKLVQRVHQSNSAEVSRWLEIQSTQWQKLRDVCEMNLVQLKATERWSHRFLDQLSSKLQPSGQEPWWSTVQRHAMVAWDYEIAAVDDRPITIGKIVMLILYIVLGVVLASLLSRVIGRTVLPRFGLNQGASQAVQKIMFYSLAVLFGSVSFQLVHIPFGAFAFLGGAAAIAIGFGSQDIANNFMSGIIILAEQPIRVGDVVLFEGVQGTVTHIGPRSTWIKTDSNYELIVPNSRLLSDKVTNMTLSDDLIQTSVSVSVAASMTVQQAKHLLTRAATSHPSVLKEPPPVVLFKQCGATTMDFELRFWLRLDDNMQAAIVQSEVRESVNELFQQKDVKPTIAISQIAKAA